MRRFFRGLTLSVLGLGLMALFGCAEQSMTSSLVIDPHASSTMKFTPNAYGYLDLSNQGAMPVEVHMYCDGSLSAIQYRLEPGGKCSVGLTGVRTVVLNNTGGGRSVVEYEATGYGDLTVSSRQNGYYAVAE